MLAIRAIGDGGDGVLYPIPGEAPNSIALDEHDGQVEGPITATQIILRETPPGAAKSKILLKAESVKVSLYITDARIAVACTKYDKGGGWVGGVTALALNAGSKAMAAVRGRGKSLVGHIRYPWISWVGYTEKSGWLSDESIRIVAVTKEGSQKTTLMLDLVLPKSMSAEKVAREITSRAAKHRLATTAMEPDVSAKMQALVDPPRLAPVPKKFSMWTFPEYFFAKSSTAFGRTELPSKDPAKPASPLPPAKPTARPPAMKQPAPPPVPAAAPPPVVDDGPELDIRLLD